MLSQLSGRRYVIRSRDSHVMPPAFLVAGVGLSLLIVVQTLLGNQLVWTYGLHTVQVVAAMRQGRLRSPS